jgi:hypothetical protein
MSYSIVLYGPGSDGEPIEYSLSDAFLTIDEADAYAKRANFSFTPFRGGTAKATSYAIKDESSGLIVRKGVFDASRS